VARLKRTPPRPPEPAPAAATPFLPTQVGDEAAPARPPSARPGQPAATLFARRAAPLLPRPDWRNFSALQWALLFSAAVHAALLTVRFVDPEAFNRVFRDTPLDVILVNARSNEAPTQAQAIAQVTLAGGGEAERGRATSPLPVAPTTEVGDASEEARRRVDQLQEEQQQLLAALRREVAALPPPDPRRDAGDPAERDKEEHRRQLLRQLAEIEKRVNEENARPKRRYISPATREEVYALYYDGLRRRIEERGTRDFPEYQGRKLYGELVMNVTVDSLGRVVDAEIVRPSSSRVLDTRAIAIVRAAAPFGAFSSAMRAQADQIVVTSRFRFTRDDALETTMQSR
jgi:protein TonB